MAERFVEITTPDGCMEAFVTSPDDEDPSPAVFLLMDIYGLRDELYEVARRFSAAGYYVILPDLHYRLGKIRLKIPATARPWDLDDLGADQDKLAREAGAAMDDAKAMVDIGSALRFLEQQPVAPGPKGLFGYCMGGRLALVAAAHFPDVFRATAGLHPSRIVHDGALSPHRWAAKFRGEIYCGFPESDPLAPTATIEAFASALEDRSAVAYNCNRHSGAIHGYALPYRHVYHPRAADIDYEQIMRMFRRQIPTRR